MIKNEWKSLLRNKLMLIVVIAIIVIPIIYAGLFLKSMWDPYGNVDSLPVAVVNEDKPVEYNGKTLSIGKDMADELKDNDSMAFNIVDSKTAEDGLANGTYYMVIKIPENFSANAATVMDDDPKQMELSYETNPGTNYIASKLSETAMLKLRDNIASKVTETYTETVFDSISEAGDGMQEAADGSGKIEDGLNTAADGNTTITKNLKKLSTSTLTFVSGADSLTEGLKTYTDGVAKLSENSSALTGGTKKLSTGAKTLSSGAATLANGTKTLANGTSTLLSGTEKLVSNNSTLNNGAKQLADGAAQIQSGSSQLYDGSKKLGSGMKELKDGSKTLTTSLSDGATTVKDNSASDETIKMFATPVVNDETKLTDVPNNGHAMAPYMMSVGLWVGALAFCLMYPLAQYKGKLKSGFAWWASKASVLYPVAILQGICLIMLLHAFNGFTPAEMGKTVLFACLASMTFTSIMYFFNITLGKVGSFLMLVFMVVQLAGSAGTYPVEVSPSFVAKIHAYVPFTYTVDAFRATISGGRTITTSIIVMVALLVIFTILTILQFNHMTKRKKAEKVVLFDWLEERGLA